MLSFLSRYLLFALFGGQVLSCLLCGTGVTSQALENFYGIAVPTTQLFLVYLAMALLYFPVLVIKRSFLDVLKENWWRYIILGLIDVEANYLVVLAYKYTTLTSIQVGDCIRERSNCFTLAISSLLCTIECVHMLLYVCSCICKYVHVQYFIYYVFVSLTYQYVYLYLSPLSLLSFWIVLQLLQFLYFHSCS